MTLENYAGNNEKEPSLRFAHVTYGLSYIPYFFVGFFLRSFLSRAEIEDLRDFGKRFHTQLVTSLYRSEARSFSILFPGAPPSALRFPYSSFRLQEEQEAGGELADRDIPPGRHSADGAAEESRICFQIARDPRTYIQYIVAGLEDEL